MVNHYYFLNKPLVNALMSTVIFYLPFDCLPIPREDWMTWTPPKNAQTNTHTEIRTSQLIYSTNQEAGYVKILYKEDPLTSFLMCK